MVPSKGGVMESGRTLAEWESYRRAEQARRTQLLRDLQWLKHGPFTEPSGRHDESLQGHYDELFQWVGLMLRQLGNVSLANRWEWVHAALGRATKHMTELRPENLRIDEAPLSDAELDQSLRAGATLIAARNAYDQVLAEVDAYLNLGAGTAA